jgi:hypothetical protein
MRRGKKRQQVISKALQELYLRLVVSRKSPQGRLVVDERDERLEVTRHSRYLFRQRRNHLRHVSVTALVELAMTVEATAGDTRRRHTVPQETVNFQCRAMRARYAGLDGGLGELVLQQKQASGSRSAKQAKRPRTTYRTNTKTKRS